MRKRAIAILMSITLAMGSIVSMPVYAAQEGTEESAEETSAPDENGIPEGQEKSEEADELDAQDETVISEDQSGQDGAEDSELNEDTTKEDMIETEDEEEASKLVEEDSTEAGKTAAEEDSSDGVSMPPNAPASEKDSTAEEALTEETRNEAARDYIDEYTDPARFNIDMDGIDESGYIYSDYLNIVNQCINQYGGTEVLNGPSSGMEHFTGLSFLKLIDFNGDGVKELFLAFYVRTNSASDNYENYVYIYNIWGFDGQKAVLLQDGNYLYGLNGGVQKVFFVNNSYGTFFLHGVADSFCHNYYYGYEGSSFGLAKTLSWEEKYDASSHKMIKVYTVDGESSSQDHYNSELDLWGSPSSADEEYSLTYTSSSDHDKVVNMIDSTIDFLMQQVEKCAIENAVVTLSGFAYRENGYDCFVHTGKQISPGVMVKLGDKTLTEGTDYTTEYGNNTDIGFGTVTIKGMGDYTGHKDVRFKIVPKKAGNLKKSDNACDPNNPDKNVGVKHRALEVTWDSQSDADGYIIEYSDDQSFAENAEIKVTEDVNTNAFTAEGLERKKKLYVRVRAYKTVNGKKFCGEYSNVLPYEICSHLVTTDFWGFKNLAHRIPRGIFEVVYPPAQVDKMINDSSKNGESGICFGMSNLATSILCRDDFNVKLSDFNVDSLYDLKSLGQDTWAQYLIRLTATLESEVGYTEEYNDINTFLSMVEEYTEKGGLPVDFLVANVDSQDCRKRESHNLVALDIVEKTDSQVKIRVYDCNYPGKDKYIYLYADTQPGNYNRWKYESGMFVMGTLQGGSHELTDGVDNDYIKVFENNGVLTYVIEVASDAGSHESYYHYEDWLLSVERQPDNTNNSFWKYIVDTHNAEVIENTGTGQENEEENTYGSFWVPKTENETLNIEGVPAGTELHLAGKYHSVTINVTEECDLRIWLPETGEGVVEVSSAQNTDVQAVFKDFDEDGNKSKKTFTESVSAGSSVKIVKKIGDVDYVASGECGENLTWTLDEDGVLTVYGEGRISDYIFSEILYEEGEAGIERAMQEDTIFQTHSIDEVAPWFFLRNDIKEIVIKDDITEVGSMPFAYCENCETVKLPESVKAIGENTFWGCKSLSEVNLPEGMTVIGYGAFDDCDSLESVQIPDSIYSLGNDLFSGCDNIKNVSLGVGTGTVAPGMFRSCISLEEISVPDSIEEIESDAFKYCSSLREIELPGSLTEIEIDAFTGCNGLKTVVFNGTRAQWKNLDVSDGNSLLNQALIKCTDGDLKPVTTLTTTLPSSTYTYTGKVITPEVTLKDGSAVLKKEKDYSVSYTNNKNVGKATVTITGKGKYQGTVKKTFTIRPKGTGINYLTTGNKRFTVRWNKQATQTTGYQIQCCKNKTFDSGSKLVTVAGTSNLSKTVTVAKAGAVYYVRVRTYKKTGTGAMYYSAWSAVKSVKTNAAGPKGTTIVSLTAGSKRFTVKWKKQAAQTTGYQIQYCRAKTFKTGAKLMTVSGASKVSKTVTVPKSGTVYYVRIRTYRKTGTGATYYSRWSSAKSVKTK